MTNGRTTAPPTTAYVSLGSNLGDREEALAFAVRSLDEYTGVVVAACSGVYETDPVGPPPQGPYLNAAVELRVEIEPEELLAGLLEIERRAGRRRSADPAERNRARTLDLDLLLYGDRCIDGPDLVVPHPRLHERAFVLEPLSEIAGEVLHPRLGSTLRDLAERVRDPEAVRSWPAPNAS